MAWTAPMTWRDGTVLTAAQLNLHLRDNLMETMPAKITGVGKYTVVDRGNHLIQRDMGEHEVNVRETCTKDAEYGDLATVGPTITRTTGPVCLVVWGAQVSPASSTTGRGFVSLSISRTGAEEDEEGTDGEETVEPDDAHSLVCRYNATSANGEHNKFSHFYMFHDLGIQDEGSGESDERAFEYQFTLKYRCTDNDVDFNRRKIFVWPLS